MLLFWVKAVMKESCNFELARLQKLHSWWEKIVLRNVNKLGIRMCIFALCQCADYACVSYVGVGEVHGTCYFCCIVGCL